MVSCVPISKLIGPAVVESISQKMVAERMSAEKISAERMSAGRTSADDS